jgi:hypothetical protein
MTKLMIRVLLTLVCVAAMCLAQVKPITKKGLVDALKIGGLTQPELVQFVKQRGVDFRLTPSDEGELKTAGASADLLAAVKSSYRAVPATPPQTQTQAQAPASIKSGPAKPLTKTEIVTLLQVGTPSDRIVQLARSRGIGFRVTPDIAAELQTAGADKSLMNTLNTVQPNHAPVAAPPKGPVMQKALVAENSAPPAAPPSASTPPPPVASPAPAPSTMSSIPPSATARILSLKDVKTVFVEAMPNNLDQFIREEVAKQLAGRMAVTTVKKDADAILTPVRARPGSPAISLTDLSGTTVLWSEDAEDRNVLFRAIKRGGPQKMAERLVSKLKVAVQ